MASEGFVITCVRRSVDNNMNNNPVQDSTGGSLKQIAASPDGFQEEYGHTTKGGGYLRILGPSRTYFDTCNRTRQPQSLGLRAISPLHF